MPDLGHPPVPAKTENRAEAEKRHSPKVRYRCLAGQPADIIGSYLIINKYYVLFLFWYYKPLTIPLNK